MCVVITCFSLVVGWVITRVTVGDDTGLKWANGDVLRYLDFANDIALLGRVWKFSHTEYRKMWQTWDSLYNINADKTKDNGGRKSE